MGPTIKGLIKIHKLNQPIRPIVKWQNALAYKLSKLFTYKINQLTPLPYTFNIKNTTLLIQALKETPLNPKHKFVSLDISNTHSNITIAETRNILNNIMKYNLLDPQTRQELWTFIDLTTPSTPSVGDKHQIYVHMYIIDTVHLVGIKKCLISYRMQGIENFKIK